MKKIYLFAVIFALITGFATYFFVNNLQHNASVTGVEEADVVVAVQDIEPDTVVKPEMFRVERLPVNAITYGTLVKASDVEGYVATEKIFKGEQVLAAKLTLIDKEKTGLEYNGEYRLSYHLENGNYAYTFTAADNSNTTFIRSGDYINIYTPAVKKAILTNVEVLEIGSYSDKKLTQSGTEITAYSLVTVSLTEKQIQTFLQYSKSGGFNIVLVPYTEGAKITTLAPKTTVNENGEAQAVAKVQEPVTNKGMGEIETTTTTTAKAE